MFPTDMMTVATVAKRLNCSQALVYALCADGILPHHRLGLGRGTIRVSETQVVDFLERTKKGGGERTVSVPSAPKSPVLKHLS